MTFGFFFLCASVSLCLCVSVVESTLSYRLEILLLVRQFLMPLGSSLNKRAEEGPRTFVAVIGAFRVPLHCQHKLIGRRSLHSLFHSVLWAPRHQPQSIAERFGRLMMAGVYRHDKFVAGGA